MPSNSETPEILISRLFSTYISDEDTDIKKIEEIIREYNKEMLNRSNPRIKITDFPISLYNELKGRGQISENSYFNNFKHDGVFPNIEISWHDKMFNHSTNLSVFLPIRMINLQEKKVENILPSPSFANKVKNYAIVSYSWGKREGEKNDSGEIEPKLVDVAKKAEGNEFSKGKTWFTLYNRLRGKIGEDVSAKSGKLYPKAYKALVKSARTLEYINKQKNEEIKERNPDWSEKDLKDSDINYLWMDQFGWDQRSCLENVENDREMLKMRRYYGNSSLTLIPIQVGLEEELNEIEEGKGTNLINWLKNPTEKKDVSKDIFSILGIIMRSEWRFSSWTFQEGWLSKQTIFIFDDVSIDGRFLAMIWAKKSINEKEDIPFEGNFWQFCQDFSGKYATPIGWAYDETRQAGENLTTIRLNVALSALIGRRRFNTLDCIKSILGLLPYGHLVEIEKWKEWEKDKSENDGKIFQRALCDVMKVGAMNGYGEFLAWCGLGDSELNSWLPTIKKGEEGKGKILRTNMIPRRRDVYCVPGSKSGNGVNFADSAIEIIENIQEKKLQVNLKGFKEYSVKDIGDWAIDEKNDYSRIYTLNEKNELVLDFFSKRKKFVINDDKIKNNENKSLKVIEIEGPKESLGSSSTENGELGKTPLSNLKFLVPHEILWKSNRINNDGTESKDLPIAFLVEKKDNKYRRIELVKVFDEEGKKLSLSKNNQMDDYKAQIEILV